MMSVYEKCPVLENEKYLLRLVEKGDASDLLSVYSDEKLSLFLTVITATATIFTIRRWSAWKHRLVSG